VYGREVTRVSKGFGCAGIAKAIAGFRVLMNELHGNANGQSKNVNGQNRNANGQNDWLSGYERWESIQTHNYRIYQFSRAIAQ
jgi:hypothetical protein